MKNLKTTIAVFIGAFIVAVTIIHVAQAHDEGHGPRLTDTGKYGGLITAVILKSESHKGTASALVYKAELVRSADGTARVYLYDKQMKPLRLSTFDTKAMAMIEARIKGKHGHSEFALERKDKLFVGKMPKPFTKPYSLDVTFKESGKELLAAFDNLD